MGNVCEGCLCCTAHIWVVSGVVMGEGPLVVDCWETVQHHSLKNSSPSHSLSLLVKKQLHAGFTREESQSKVTGVLCKCLRTKLSVRACEKWHGMSKRPDMSLADSWAVGSTWSRTALCLTALPHWLCVKDFRGVIRKANVFFWLDAEWGTLPVCIGKTWVQVGYVFQSTTHIVLFLLF